MNAFSSRRNSSPRSNFALLALLLLSAWISAPLTVNAADPAQFVTRLAAGQVQTVVTYGTSLTAGGAWVNQFRSVLETNYPGRVKVINSAKGGMWSAWGVTNLDARVIANAPDAVIIEFAINDAFLQYKTSADDARRNLENMIDRIQKARPSCEVILMTMNPPVGVHLERRPKIDDYYAVYREVAGKRRLLLVDHHRNWQEVLAEGETEFRKLVPDGIHPSSSGCERVILPELKCSLMGIR